MNAKQPQENPNPRDPTRKPILPPPPPPKKYGTQSDVRGLDMEYAEKISAINTDPEEAHMLADADLRELLLKFGFTQTVAAYDAIKPKWYA